MSVSAKQSDWTTSNSIWVKGIEWFIRCVVCFVMFGPSKQSASVMPAWCGCRWGHRGTIGQKAAERFNLSKWLSGTTWNNWLNVCRGCVPGKWMEQFYRETKWTCWTASLIESFRACSLVAIPLLHCHLASSQVQSVQNECAFLCFKRLASPPSAST